jgi:hypothetical protein
MTLETATMTVDGFEDLGVIIVRPRTNAASAYVIPALHDRELSVAMQALSEIDGEGMSADTSLGNQVRYNTLLIAVARYAIVEPKDLIDQILEDSDPKKFDFFIQFAQEYGAWMDARSEEAQGKKSGTEKKDRGKKSASSSETATDSPPLTLAG